MDDAIHAAATVLTASDPYHMTLEEPMRGANAAICVCLAALILGAAADAAYVKKATARETWEAANKSGDGGTKFGPWRYIGPFDSTDGKGFDAVYPPERELDFGATYEGKGGKPVSWQMGYAFRDGEANSLRIFPDNDWIAAYVHRTIEVPEAISLPVLLGSDDTITVWLNGEKLLAHNVGRGVTLGDERVVLNLRPGKNDLLLKICQGAGPSGFAFAVDTGEESLLERVAADFPDQIQGLLMELDWERQAVAPKRSPNAPMTPEEDAPGGCDGVKDGGTGFHTQLDQDPWWLVDLEGVHELGHALLYNREDAGSRNRTLILSLSVDGEKWEQVWKNNGVDFHGATDGKPMVVDLGRRKARYVKLHLAERQFLHLDEVEVFGVADPQANLAVGKYANQSSASPWSTYTPRVSASNEDRDRARFRSSAFEAMDLTARTLDFVQQARPLPDLAEKVRVLKARLDAAGADTDWRNLYLDIRRLRRQIILSHPLLDFERMVVTKRGPPMYSHMVDQYEGRHSQAGDGLVMLENWRTSPVASALLKDKLPRGSVLHPDISFDGRRIVFSFCDHSIFDRNQRRYFLHELDLDSGQVRQLTGVPGIDPLEGWAGRQTVLIEDFDPAYLPDGGIVFVSTRNQGFGRCHGGRYTPSYVLYRCDADGSNIKRLSYGEANEWDPSVLPNGLIIYTRWDYINRHDTVLQSLWFTRPDGSAVGHYYGNSTRNPCMTAEARAIPGSDRVVATAMAHHSYTAGSLIAVERRHGEDGPDAITRITPEVSFPETEGWAVGAYAGPWPISDDLYLAAFSPDRHITQGNIARFNAYGIYLVDTLGGRELVYRDPSISCFDPLPVQARETPPVLPSALTPGMEDGVFVIQNVYQCVEPLPPGSAKRVRVVQMWEQPEANSPIRSVVDQEIVKGVVGTVPVREDGSVVFRAPAKAPLLFQVLDENNVSLFNMRSQVYLQPGETMSCAGCHEPRGTVPTGYPRVAGVEPARLEPSPGPRYEGGFSFARSVQPVMDRYCIRCHGLKHTAAEVNLLGTHTEHFSQAYEALVGREGLVKLAHRNAQTDISKIGDYGARGGKLAQFLLGEHAPKARMDPDSFTRIAEWLDLNAQYYGDYVFNRPERRKPSEAGEKALRAYVAQACGACHEGMSEQPLAALVNVALPSESRVLQAPLAEDAGGWGQCQEWWDTKQSAGYKAMLAKVMEAVGE